MFVNERKLPLINFRILKISPRWDSSFFKDISQECTDQIGLRFSEHPPARRIYLCGHGGFLSGCITGLMGRSPAVVLGCGERMDSKWDRLEKMAEV